ncbi:MAG: glycosyltransferase family 9 protein [Planctomycetes bacterium]|nr:glycosyltransferase family 9 protein [Planctomycetota bacterium]
MRPPTDIPAPRNVLIVKPSALGDVITALPVLRGLRRTFGTEVRIDWLLSGSCAAAVAADPHLDAVVLFDRKRYGALWRNAAAVKDFLAFCRKLRAARYDWVLDLQGLFRSGLFTAVTRAPVRAGFQAAREGAALAYTHTLPAAAAPLHTVDRNIALARIVGIDGRGEDFFTLHVPPAARAWADEFAAAYADGFVVAAPATRWTTKLYPTRHWRGVLAALARRRPVVLVAGAGEAALTAPLADLDGVIDLTGRTTIEQLIALIGAAKGLISGDSAAMHIAAALGTPQVTLIGPTDPARTGPYRVAGGLVTADLPCSGCLRRSCPHRSCMELLAPERVQAALAETGII